MSSLFPGLYSFPSSHRMQPSPVPPLSPIRVARNMYRAALASTVADIVPRLMECVTESITEQAGKGDMYIKLYTKDEFTLEHRPSGLETLLANEECVPSGITVNMTTTATPKVYTINVRGAVALCKTGEKGILNGVDMVKEVRSLIESRKRKPTDAAPLTDEPPAKKARTDAD